MAMIYTLVTSAKEWLCERFAQDTGTENTDEEEAAKEDVCLFVLPLFRSPNISAISVSQQCLVF